jgi:hypothetical protein
MHNRSVIEVWLEIHRVASRDQNNIIFTAWTHFTGKTSCIAFSVDLRAYQRSLWRDFIFYMSKVLFEAVTMQQFRTRIIGLVSFK